MGLYTDKRYGQVNKNKSNRCCQKQPAAELELSTPGGADLVKDAGEGAGCVAFEGELAFLCALGTGPLEQHAGHAVPVVSTDNVRLECYVG